MRTPTIIAAIVTPLVAIAALYFIAYPGIEESFQQDADLQRIEDFEYYNEILDFYIQETETFPLIEQFNGEPVYVIINPGSTPEWVIEQNPEVTYLEDELLLDAFTSAFGEELTLRYDPQMQATDSRPNFYVYSIDKFGAGFTVHLYGETEGAVYIDENYWKLEDFVEFEEL